PLASNRIDFTPPEKGVSDLGKLHFRGALVLSSSDERVGGISGLALSADGRELLAISDRGWWLRGRIEYRDSEVSGIAISEIAPMLDQDGGESHVKIERDAEALSLVQKGKLRGSAYVSFEGRSRIELFDFSNNGLSARPVAVAIPDALRRLPRDHGIEALGFITNGPHAGSLIATTEKGFDADGNIVASVFNGKTAFDFAIERYEDFTVTDLAVTDDGEVFTLERSDTESLPSMALRRFRLEDVMEQSKIRPELLFSGRRPFYNIDNMEALAVHDDAGERRITVMSDDNYVRAQRTIFLQFAIEP
ncbi:MAG TPA: esterase-like activity of phytase family protein, partial [Burkholderiaceae bacterium]|nr:esterase-like activity of phytase family protein [Burkholderiaceae bacterium]